METTECWNVTYGLFQDWNSNGGVPPSVGVEGGTNIAVFDTGVDDVANSTFTITDSCGGAGGIFPLKEYPPTDPASGVVAVISEWSDDYNSESEFYMQIESCDRNQSAKLAMRGVYVIAAPQVAYAVLRKSLSNSSDACMGSVKMALMMYTLEAYCATNPAATECTKPVNSTLSTAPLPSSSPDASTTSSPQSPQSSSHRQSLLAAVAMVSTMVTAALTF